MGISGVKAVEGISAGQPADALSKNIQNELSEVQRQKRELSSKEDISVEEKAKKRQELQQEMSSLNAKLRQRQAEVRKEQMRKEQQKEVLAEEQQRSYGGNLNYTENKDKENKDIADKDIEDRDVRNTHNNDDRSRDKKIAGMEMRALVAAEDNIEQSRHQGAVIARMEEGIVILKGEIRQDESRNEDVKKKKEELEKQEKRLEKAMASQFSALGETYRDMREVRQAKADEAIGKPAANVRRGSEEGVIIKATNYTKKEEQAGRQLYVSVNGHRHA